MTGPQQPGWGDQPGQQPQQPGQPGWGNQAPMSKKDAKAQAAAAKAYSKSQRSWFAKHKILTAFGALFLLAVIISVASGGGSGGGGDSVSTDAGSSSDSADAKAPKAPAPAEPAMVVSADELIAALEGNALKAKNTYEGKRVTVSGFVGNIDASGKYFALDPSAEAFVLTGVQVRTSKKFQDQVANLSQDQAVTVTGKITGVGEVLGYSLEAETIG
jgi:hypothetical protein